MQNAYLVDALSREDAFAKEVLIDVRDSARVDIEASLTGVERCKAGARCRRNADPNTRLKNAVACCDNTEPRIDDGVVQRMGDRANHARSSTARELSIGIQGDDVSNPLQSLDWSGLDGKTVEGVKQEFVQVEQLSPLPLPTHPDTLP